MALAILRQVVVDDTDHRIQYTGPGWFLDSSGSQDAIGYGGPAYQHTLHGTKVNGVQVTVLGTYNPRDSENVTLAWRCLVDNIDTLYTTQSADPPGNNVRLCGSDGLDDGPHELTVNVTAADQTFWLDSIRYSPSPNLPPEPGAVWRIDNTDPDIVYSGGLKWRNEPETNTIHKTAILGSTANIRFTGTGLSWIGSIPTELPHVPSQGTYSIDGGPQVPFYLNLSAPDTNMTLYNQEFFSTGNLSASSHTLQVIYQGNDSQTPLTLDFLYLTTNSSATNPSTTTTTTTLNTKPSTSTITSPSSGVPSLSMHRRPIGAIAGSVIGCTALIVLMLALFFWYRRRHNQAWSNDTRPEVTPYSYDTSDTGSHPATVRYNPVSDSMLQKREIIVRSISTWPPFDERSALTPPSLPPSSPLLPPSHPSQEDPPPSYAISTK